MPRTGPISTGYTWLGDQAAIKEACKGSKDSQDGYPYGDLSLKSAHLLTMMIFVLVEEGLRAIVEQMDAAMMERGQHPWPVFMEGQALDALALRLKLGFHHLAKSAASSL